MAIKEEKYKETKVCKCICCGKDVTVTKFASAAKVMCGECKKSGAQPNTDIIASIPAKKIEPRTKYGGDTKVCKCIKCGKDVTVTKFASAAKVLCDECKGESGGYTQHGEIDYEPVINLKKIDRNIMPTLEEYTITPALFANKALRNIKCPACGHEHMKILKVLDWSTSGLIVHYQCPSCKLLVSVSEQTKTILRNMKEGVSYSYSGDEIMAGVSSVSDSRKDMAIIKLMKIINDNGIKVPADDIPPYVYEESRPVPVGYSIPKDDESIKTIDDMIKILESAKRQGSLIDTPEGTRYIEVSDTIAKKMAAKLKKLLEVGGPNG